MFEFKSLHRPPKQFTKEPLTRILRNSETQFAAVTSSESIRWQWHCQTIYCACGSSSKIIFPCIVVNRLTYRRRGVGFPKADCLWFNRRFVFLDQWWRRCQRSRFVAPVLPKSTCAAVQSNTWQFDEHCVPQLQAKLTIVLVRASRAIKRNVAKQFGSNSGEKYYQMLCT